MWAALDIWLLIEYVRENPTEVQLLCILVVLAVAALYMTFGQHQPIWLAYAGAGAIPLLILIAVAARQEPR